MTKVFLIHKKKIFLILTIGLLLSLIINIKFVFFFISLFFFLYFYLTKNIILLSLFYVFLTFFIFEIFYENKNFFNKNKNEYNHEHNISYDYDNEIGYKPKKNFKYFKKVFFKNKKILDVEYTIDHLGFRTSNTLYDQSNCLLLYGGSDIFGQSINDDETLSWILNKKLKYKVTVINFGFNGYGPHQFLAMINKNEKLFKKCKKIATIYIFSLDHIGRVVGKRDFGIKSPKFDLKNNILKQNKLFSNYPNKFYYKIKRNLSNSIIIKQFYNYENLNKNDELIFTKIISSIEEYFFNNFSKVDFYYIFSDSRILKNNPVTSSINYHLIDSFFKNRKTLYIHKIFEKNSSALSNNIDGDNHPRPEYYVKLSKILIEKLNWLNN